MADKLHSKAAESPLAAYQARLARGEFAYQFSPRAGRAVFFPRLVCPFTGSADLEWRVSGGKGTVYATTTVFPRDAEPYDVSLVEVDEGFRLMSRVEEIDPLSVTVGMRVEVRIRESGGEHFPVFVPMEAADE